MSNNTNPSPAQWAAIRSRRGKTALAAKALWDVVLGLEPDGRTDAGDYIKFYRIAQTAVRHFRAATTPTYDERRPKVYREYTAILSALGEAAIERMKIGFMQPAQEHRTDREKEMAKTPKKQPKERESAVVSGPEGAMCVACEADPAEPGKQHCRYCVKALDRYATLLADGMARTPTEIEASLELEADTVCGLNTDPRFVETDDRWTLAPKANIAPTEPKSPAVSVAKVEPVSMLEDDWSAPEEESSSSSGLMPDESCPAYGEFIAAMEKWEAEGVGAQPKPEQFDGMIWKPAKPRPRRKRDDAA